MIERRATGNGSAQRFHPRLPLTILVVALVVAVGAVSGLIYVLYQRTTGPGEVLRSYYEAVAAGDCDASIDFLSPSLRQGIDRDAYCVWVDRHRDTPLARFTVRSSLLPGEEPSSEADVTVVASSGGPELTYRLIRSGRAWLVAGFPGAARPDGLP